MQNLNLSKGRYCTAHLAISHPYYTLRPEELLILNKFTTKILKSSMRLKKEVLM